MTPFLTMLGMWAVTWASRYLGLSLGGLKLPPFWLAFLRFVPISVFAALVVPDLASAPDAVRRALAAVLAGLLMWRTRQLAVGILGGFGGYWVLRWLGIG
ncbi:AzlD domain-containing protein [Deinococcus sp. KNUC1210]|uniref:AzlD domain-containing protein n=1 Tax=Deinococcus sp. KNUC1210 TaxID=2917691 RepID=UPI001EEF99A5|nr:AzlD domain-containing protein [Deinococcus sp. KNUC1210]ULH15149.1 AzlD domain-containing protein [Deinococcus sp. KNUC1210]